MATENVTLYFRDIFGNENGSISYENGTITGSDEGKQHLIDEHLERGLTPEDIVEKFTDWTSGYSQTYTK